jgi:hypothetical protein
MDDFRVGPISPYDPDRRPVPSGAAVRRRAKRAEDQESDPSEAEAPAGEGTIQDYYQPSTPPEESES